MLAQCAAFLSSPVLPSPAAISAASTNVPCAGPRPLKMAADSVEERKQRMMEKARANMDRRAAMRPKKTYRPPITYPRQFTPQMREAQKKLIDSPEMESYMRSLVDRGYMVEIKGKIVSLESGGAASSSGPPAGSDDE